MEGKYVKNVSDDESTFYPWFELNHLGQPICLNEYATHIASGSNTHVIHLDDFQPNNDPIMKEHIDKNANF